MFKKLLSNLPFNPSLIGQVAFYAKRVHREAAIRALGLTLMTLAMAIQLFAVVSPPESSLALSDNDIIPGGFSSRDTAVNHCNQNNYNFRDILAYYKVSCANLSSASTRDIKSTDYNKQLYSMGRRPYGKTGEYSVTIAGKTYYMRYLWSWDSGAYSTYKALVGTNSSGQPFMVLYNCGNLVTIGKPAPPPPAPAPPPPPPPPPNPQGAIVKKVNGNDSARLKVGERFNYSLTVTNKGQVDMTNIAVSDTAPDGIEFIPNTTTTTKTVFETTIPRLGVGSSRSFTIPAKVTRYVEGQTINQGCFLTNGTGGCDKAYTVTESPCPYNSSLPKDSPECVPCEEAENIDDKTACLELSKEAENVTQNIEKASGTTAKPGDTITYTLSVKNTGKATVKKFVVEEHMADILEYAEIVDKHGSTLSQEKILRWPGTDISPKETIKKKITIKIKDPLPQTPRSASDPGSFDLLMTNVYGNTVEIKLPPTIVKTTEQVVQTLPNTGPGTSLIIGFSGTTVMGYFFARSRLLAKELDIARSEFAASGGI